MKFTVLQRSSGLCSVAGGDKEVPLQAWSGPEGSRNLRLPDFKKIDTSSLPPSPGIYFWYSVLLGTEVAQWLRCCAKNRKVAGSIPVGVIGFFVDIKSFRPYYGPGVDSASNRNEYQEYFLVVKADGAYG